MDILGWELGALGPARLFGRAEGFVLLARGFSGAEGVGAGVGGILPLGSCPVVLVAAPGMRFSGLSWHQGEEEVEQVPAEILYQGLLPSLPQYMVSWGALASPGSVPSQ